MEQVSTRYFSLATYEKVIDRPILTPRSLVRLFNQPKNDRGSFRVFSERLSGDRADETGRTVEVMCSEYLYVNFHQLWGG